MLMEFVDEMKQSFEEMGNETTFLNNSEFCDPSWSSYDHVTDMDQSFPVATSYCTNVWSFEDSPLENLESGMVSMPQFEHCTNTIQNADELGKLVQKQPTMFNSGSDPSVSTGSSISNEEKCSKTPFVNNLDYATSSSGCTSLFSNLGLDKLLYGTSKRRRFETSLPSSTNVRNGNLEERGSENPSKTIKKKAKPGTRPIPKDRLLTCARLAELRELIPNGDKMSIDRLLLRTIKHLHFLQSVTKHTKTLAKSEERKVANGVTWACEIENETMICPLIVEDLSTPGQMIIEILCEEQGLFLEIVDIIRSFGLNIVNGFMEVHEAKISARYIVEAAEADMFVSRHEIFSELVRVLQLIGPGENRANDHW